MRETEFRAGMCQWALLGVSAAQIAKRNSIDGPTVNAALAVSKAGETRAKYEAGDLTLEHAAIYAEFEDDEAAIARLDRPRTSRGGHSAEHVAQKLRDRAAQSPADHPATERPRTAGVPGRSFGEADIAEGPSRR